MAQAKIDIQNLNFFYQKKHVIHDFSLAVPANQIMSVFGPANSGITTLLRSLNRLYELTPGARVEGKILMDGKDIHDPDINVTELRRKVGMVFDVPTPLAMSIYDNISYGPRLTKVKRKSVLDEIVEQSLKMAALWEDVCDRLDHPATSLSGGQQQRLCIARVLALKPEVILLDRPCSGLDPISTSKIEESLEELKKQFTIVIAPHNTQQVRRISDYAAFMLLGDLIEQGSAEEMFANPRYQRTSDYITGRFG